MNKQILISYLRHLVTTAVGAVVAIVNVKHIGLAHLTKSEVLSVANAAWIAIIPQLRHTAPVLIDWYLKKQFPALGIVLADLKSFNSQAAATPAPAATPVAAPVAPVVPGV